MASSEGHKKKVRQLLPSARTSTRLGLGEVDVIAPGVLHFRFAGKIYPDQAQIIVEVGNEAVNAGYRPIIAVDASDVHAYESEVRKTIQAWLKVNHGQIAGFWVLVASPVVRMGVNLMAAMLGRVVRSFDDHEEFDRELQQVRVEAEAAAAAAAAGFRH